MYDHNKNGIVFHFLHKLKFLTKINVDKLLHKIEFFKNTRNILILSRNDY